MSDGTTELSLLISKVEEHEEALRKMEEGGKRYHDGPWLREWAKITGRLYTARINVSKHVVPLKDAESDAATKKRQSAKASVLDAAETTSGSEAPAKPMTPLEEMQALERELESRTAAATRLTGPVGAERAFYFIFDTPNGRADLTPVVRFAEKYGRLVGMTADHPTEHGSGIVEIASRKFIQEIAKDIRETPALYGKVHLTAKCPEGWG